MLTQHLRKSDPIERTGQYSSQALSPAFFAVAPTPVYQTRGYFASTTVLTKLGEDFPQSVVIHVIPKVFDVDVGELHRLRPKLCLALFAGFEVTNKPAGSKERDMEPSASSAEGRWTQAHLSRYRPRETPASQAVLCLPMNPHGVSYPAASPWCSPAQTSLGTTEMGTVVRQGTAP